MLASSSSHCRHLFFLGCYYSLAINPGAMPLSTAGDGAAVDPATHPILAGATVTPKP